MIQEVALSGNESYSSHKSSTAESFSLSSGLNPLVVIFSVKVLFVPSQYLYIVFRDHHSERYLQRRKKQFLTFFNIVRLCFSAFSEFVIMPRSWCKKNMAYKTLKITTRLIFMSVL